jgi:4-hydroxy-tetrahydrodipicolinate synthase
MKAINDGIWPVMLTPFNEDGSIDMSALDGLIDFYINYGVAGLFACCGSSEINKLTPNEMIQISKYVIKSVDGRASVVTGAILFSDIKAQINFAKEIAATGADAVIISTNQFNDKEETDEKFFNKLQFFTESLPDIPLGTYELPRPYHRIIPSSAFKWMVGSGRFVFHKDTSCDIENIKTKIDICRNTKVKLFNAHLGSLLDSFIAGGNGYCGTGTNYCPELYSWLWKNFKTNPQKARSLHQYLIKFENQVDSGGNYPASAKAYLKLRQVGIEPFCRVGVRKVVDSQIKQLSEVLADTRTMKDKLLKV